jgi:NAD(P)-dependent dehydrogenase (short-subunit alcohol dehydrogenase family)
MSTSRVVVVTGASGGVGRAVARRFGARGDRVALLACGEAGLDGALDDIRAAGGEALAVPVDVADAEAVDAAATTVEEAFGPIDVWVNVGFSSIFAPFIEIQPSEFRRVTAVTYLGYVYGTRAALSRMLPRDRGTVVQVGSALAYRGIPLQSAYCGAKHAIQGFHESLRCELLHRHSRVRTTMVQLPAVNTPQPVAPGRRRGRPRLRRARRVRHEIEGPQLAGVGVAAPRRAGGGRRGGGRARWLGRSAGPAPPLRTPVCAAT